MDDDMILERGGTQEDIDEYARKNGADLTEADIIIDEQIRAAAKRTFNISERMSLDEMPAFFHGIDEDYG